MRFSSGVRISAFFYVLGVQVFGVVRGAGGIPLVGDGGRDLQGVALAEMGPLGEMAVGVLYSGEGVDGKRVYLYMLCRSRLVPLVSTHS